MTNDRETRAIHHIVTPVLTFFVGALVGAIYGWIIASQKWSEEMEEVRRTTERIQQQHSDYRRVMGDDYGR